VRNEAQIHTLERSKHSCPWDIPPNRRSAVCAAIDTTTCPAKTPVPGIPAVTVVIATAVATATATHSVGGRAASDRRLDEAHSAPRS